MAAEIGQLDLLQALREADEPSAADRERVRDAVMRNIALGAGVAAAASLGTASTTAAGGGAAAAGGGAGAGGVAAGVATMSTPPGAGAAAGAGALVAAKSTGLLSGAVGKILALTLGAGIVGGAALLGTGGSEPEQPAGPTPAVVAPVEQPSEAKAQKSDRAEPEAAPEEESPAEAPTKPRKEARKAVKAPDRSAQLLDEVQLLREAQQAIGRGQPTEALSLLAEHAKRHPKGVLTQERLGVQAIALCQAGQVGQGSAQAKRFLANNPKSPLAERMRAACKLGE